MKPRRKHARLYGTFSAWPHSCHNAPAFTRLTLPARALLFEFLGQLRRANNGDLTCAWAILKPRGWRSRDTIERARAELEQAGWIVRTRRGWRNAPNLYAVTWLSIDDCGGKLEIGPCPALGTWQKNDLPCPGNGQPLPDSRATVARESGNPTPSLARQPG